jgi:nicotinate-nucleotide--dimethylbenzimidazole phosphoribosyltransferase
MSSPTNDPPSFPTVPPAGAGRPVELSRSHFGDLVTVAEWFTARRDERGALRRPRVVLVVGRHEGPDDGSPDPGAVADWCDRLGGPSGVSVGLLDHRHLVTEASDSDSAKPTVEDASTPGSASRTRVLAAIDAGRRAADAEVDAGMDLLIPGLVGTGQSVPVGTLTSLCVGLEPADAVPVSGIDVAHWAAVVSGIRDQRFALRLIEKDAVSVLAGTAAVDVAALVGLIAQAAVRKTPVLLDGTAATLAALLANRLAPGSEAWFLAAGPSSLRGCRRLQEMLGLPAVTALGTDSAVGAVLLLPLIQAALTAAD